MTSKLVLDNIAGRTTAGSITIVGEGNSTTTNLQQGLAKVFHAIDQTGTMTTLDSFNISDFTDNATGSTTSTFTNNMGNANYVYNLSRDRTGSQNGGIVQQSSSSAPATSSVRYSCFNETPSSQDVDRACISIDGDLA